MATISAGYMDSSRQNSEGKRGISHLASPEGCYDSTRPAHRSGRAEFCIPVYTEELHPSASSAACSSAMARPRAWAMVSPVIAAMLSVFGAAGERRRSGRAVFA